MVSVQGDDENVILLNFDFYCHFLGRWYGSGVMFII